MKKLAIVTTHPIQYNAPWFKLLDKKQKFDLRVFYTWSQSKEEVQDKTFGRTIKWDVPLLDGYGYEFVPNISTEPGIHWKGIDNPALISQINKFNPDAVLVFGWNLKSHFRVLRYFKDRIPVWFRGDSTLLDESKGLKTFFRRLWLTFVYRHVDRAFYVGRENRKYYQKHGLKEKQLCFSPHAIDNERFYNNSDKKYEKQAHSWRKELGLRQSDFVLLFAGKFEAKKDPLSLINAVQRHNQNEERKLKLILIGNGPLEQKINSIIKEDEHIIQLPFQNQTRMPVVYRLGDIFCLPSKGPGETWGLAVNEAMASSRPVLVSDKMGCTIDLVKEGKNGFIFEAGNVDQLTNIFKDLSAELCQEMGVAALKTIEVWNYETLLTPILQEMEKIDNGI